ncbi:MAG TPA: diguanylate cyclase [Gemmatimonadota bacterium]|nr:diguanylate cyclase [Gemmatimonadota bacterium]
MVGLRLVTLAAAGVLLWHTGERLVYREAALSLWALYGLTGLVLIALPERHFYHRRFDSTLVAFDSLLLGSFFAFANGGSWIFLPLFLLVILLSALTQRLVLALMMGCAVATVYAFLALEGSISTIANLLPNELILQVLIMVTTAGVIGYLTEEMTKREVSTDLLESALQITSLVSGALDSQSTYEQLMDVLHRLFRPGRVAVIHIPPGSDVGVVTAAIDNGQRVEGLEIQLNRYPEIRAALASGEPVVIGRTANYPGLLPVHNPRLRGASILVAPILVDAEPRGVLFVRVEDYRTGFTPLQITFCRLMANAAAQAMMRDDRFESQADQDVLTGLPTLRSFHRRLDEQVAHARNHGDFCALIVIDVDHLGRINYTHGHRFGDEVIAHVASCLQEEIRDYDIAARSGGEEFAVVLPGADEEQALAVAERIHERIRERGALRFHQAITVSIGLATVPQDATSSRELQQSADRALYLSKYRGRDQTTNYGSLPREMGEEGVERELMRAFTSVEIERHFDSEDSRINAIRQQLMSADATEDAKGQQLDGVVRSLTLAVAAKDRTTAHHLQEAAGLAQLFLSRLDLDEEERRMIQIACMLHDVGKLGISEMILGKPDLLTGDEYEIVRRHPMIGAKILEPVGRFRSIVPFVRHHHERWDGAGYPDGLAAEEIPFGARVVGLIDAFHAMVSERPYKRAEEISYAIGEIERNAGTQFDPILAAEFLSMLGENEVEIRELLGEATAADPPPPTPLTSFAVAVGDAAVEGAAGNGRGLHSVNRVARIKDARHSPV